MATRSATWAYRDRFGDEFGRTYFRRHGESVVSSIGLGTYLGDPTSAVDTQYEGAIVTAIESGCNVVDTAINYRCQRSERVVGRAIDRAEIDREAVLVATKGGYLPFDGRQPDDPGEYVRRTFVDTGLVDPADLARGRHCIAPAFLDDQLDRSLSNLDLETIDLYYVHNPETQLAVRSREAVYDQLELAFERLEERVAAGDLRGYGVATWDAFRVLPDNPNHLSLPEVVSRARTAAQRVGNETTGLDAIQLPFNATMADAFTVEAHESPEGVQSALTFAQEAGLSVFASAPLAQGKLANGLPPEVDAILAGDTPAARAINFARSAPGVTSALVGMSTSQHVQGNLGAGRYDPLGAREFDAVFE